MNSDNRISSGKPATVPRLSLRITRDPSSMKDGDNDNNNKNYGQLMSPRMTSVALSSSSKEVPRAALNNLNNSPPSTSDISEIISIEGIETQNLIQDSIQGLEALAASAIAASAEKTHEPVVELNEDEILGNIFNKPFDVEIIKLLYKEHCSNESAFDKLMGIIEKADELLKSKSISMSLKNVFPLFIERILQQERKRTGNLDFTKLLLDEDFLSASATVILMLPRLISILFRVEEVALALDSSLFDVLLSIEQVLKAIPELQGLPSTQKRLQQLQNILLEDSLWRSSIGMDNTLFKLIQAEFAQVESLKQAMNTQNPGISNSLTGIRSSQRALETLSGFPVSGARLSRLELFFRKYLRLAAQRLQYATHRLGLSQSITQLSWELFFELVQQEDGGRNTCSLLRNRHLNQILLSIIYCASHLLEDDRSFQQISQVLPSAQSQSAWLKGTTSDCDFYTFYNEKFIPPLRRKIETFLLKRGRENTNLLESDTSTFLLNGLFTTAPFPINQLHFVTPNITINRLNQRKSPISTDKYEWVDPTKNTNTNTNTKTCEEKIPQTPTNTSQLMFNWPPAATPQKRHNTIESESESDNNFRIQKVARRLDFSE